MGAALDSANGHIEQGNDQIGTILWIYDHCEAEKTAAVHGAVRETLPWYRRIFSR